MRYANGCDSLVRAQQVLLIKTCRFIMEQPFSIQHCVYTLYADLPLPGFEPDLWRHLLTVNRISNIDEHVVSDYNPRWQVVPPGGVWRIIMSLRHIL